ncbi:hypothetical protein [Azospirillum argentinense]|uniref:hypothetical protein n=1 Tax=Azospirillum argentinense TaxID=2970906 RepID=UPI0032DF429B
MTTAPTVFKACVQAIRNGSLIRRDSRSDKEFHFQNWFKARLDEMGVPYDSPGRNSYPDFRLVRQTDGYELKGLAYPGRDASYDCNSQVPRGEHNGREVYYVFGRYPKDPDGNTYPVLDLVICHGSFLNADSSYVHKNKSFRGFGSYGDILVRDRKMYVAPTPYALAIGTAHTRTLIMPASTPVDSGFVKVGEMVRQEASQLVAAYSFDLLNNQLHPQYHTNPNAGRVHTFAAYRLTGDPMDPVSLRNPQEILQELDGESDDE